MFRAAGGQGGDGKQLNALAWLALSVHHGKCHWLLNKPAGSERCHITTIMPAPPYLSVQQHSASNCNQEHGRCGARGVSTKRVPRTGEPRAKAAQHAFSTCGTAMRKAVGLRE